jgi:hypothetical protein
MMKEEKVRKNYRLKRSLIQAMERLIKKYGVRNQTELITVLVEESDEKNIKR